MEEDEKQHTVQELLDQYTGELPPHITPYSLKHFKRLLLHYLDTKITIAEVDGRPNVVTLSDQACSILHDSYKESLADGNVDEDLRSAKRLGRTVKNAMKDMPWT